MGKYKIGWIVQDSWSKTTSMLWRPYNIKKWVFLLTILVFAGYFGGLGTSFNFNKGDKGLSHEAHYARSGNASVGGGKANLESLIRNSVSGIKTFIVIASGEMKKNIFLAITVYLLIASLITAAILWIIVRSVFLFVTIDSLLRNDASIRVPYHRCKKMGVSYVWWNTIFGAIVIAAILSMTYFGFRSLFLAGFFGDITRLFSVEAARHLKSLLAPAAILFCLLFLARTFATDFVSLIMYSEGISVWKAWGKFMAIFARNAVHFILYFLTLIPLFILAILALIAMVVLTLLTILLLGGATALVGVLILLVTPVAAKPIVMMVLVIPAAIIFTLIYLLVSTYFIPIPVFFRFFSMRYFSSVYEPLDAIFTEWPRPAFSDEERLGFTKPLFAVGWACVMPMIALALIVIIVIIGGISFANQQLAIVSPSVPIPVNAPVTQYPPPQPINPNIIAGKWQKTIVLMNGRRVKGAIVSDDATSITLDIGSGTVTIKKENIKSIE